MQTPHPILLLILDGFGHSEETEYNAITAANTPNYNKLWQKNPHLLISGSGNCVGLPEGQMGNSEVGHLTVGAGRTLYQDLTRIQKAIDDGEFAKNLALVNACQKAKSSGHALHILGLLSDGGVHSDEQQIHAMIKLAAEQGVKQIFLHAFLDGRDTPPQSALTSITKTQNLFSQLGVGQIASLIGRFYAMDRDKRWDRVQSAYELLVNGKAAFTAESAIAGLNAAYARGETDEFVQATLIKTPDQTIQTIQDNDVVIFMNFRADRARELSHALLDETFQHFPRARKLKLAEFVTLTQYAKSLPATIAFAPIPLKNILGEYLSSHGYQQLRIAETEKYAHVTFFFNGGIEQPFANEERILIPSPKVATYDLKPEMSAFEITEQLVKALKEKKFDFILCNMANPDMVGHTGNFAATVKAIEVIDECLGKIIQALEETNSELILTADHGNAEMMFDKTTQQPHTAHTCELVPFIYHGRHATTTQTNGSLQDIAPTILYLFNLEIPKEMTGNVLLTISQ